MSEGNILERLARGDVILMDEPFVSVDAIQRSQLRDFLMELWKKENKTIIFVTHDIEEAILLGTRIVLLSGRPGKIVESFDISLNYPTYNKAVKCYITKR